MSNAPFDSSAPNTPSPVAEQPWGMSIKQFTMLMHLSQLLNFMIPFAGVVMPIVMWVVHKDKFPEIDAHGKAILNFIISMFIYSVISAILIFLIVGFFLLIAIAIISIVFPIIAAVKANEGKLWPYPLSLKLF